MTPERWQQVNETLDAAWRLDPADRCAYLDRICENDRELRAEVETLLAADANSDGLLETGAIALAELPDAAFGNAMDEFANDSAGASDPAGTRIGRYTIQNVIGRGGMGVVYRALREDDFRMQVAIKLLHLGTDTDAALERFRAERQILAGLQHPNIARLVDGGATDAGLPYLVMEYIDGTPLLDYAAPLPVRQRVELFHAVCQAIHHAHQHSVVHRDIKPANILVTREGTPKVLDFGIAKLLDDSAAGSGAVTGAGMRLMTPDYASPEQARGEPVTTATDIYSLGAVLYELLTGRRAGTRESSRNELDADLESIVGMAMREEPERRYATALELSNDLERFLENLPVRARREGPLYRARKFVHRNRVPLMAAALGGALVITFFVGLRRFTGSDAGARSIAVLPLENLSGDKEQQYFAEGVTDALINSLAEMPDVRVISRTSTASIRRAGRSLPEIAASLGVGTIAEGSILRSGDRVRLAVRLVDAHKDRPMWSGSYEGELRDVLALREQVAGAIAGEIGLTLSARRQSRMSRSRRVNMAAFDAYLKGRHQYFTGFTRESTEKAIAYFQQALALDENYAPAYAGLADCYYGLSNVYSPPTEVMPKAKAAALKAIELDDTEGEAHATLALVQALYEFDRTAAGKEFRRALELKPSNAEAHLWYGIHLADISRFDEASTELELARTLDPASVAMTAYVGLPLYCAHKYDEMIQRLRPIADMNPDYHHPHAFLGLAYEQKGEWSKAIAEMERAYKLDDEPEALAQLGHLYAVAGRTADARRVLDQLSELSHRRYVSAYNFAVLYAGLGDRDEAFRWLQKVEQDRSEWFAAVNVDPRLGSLHSDPRFAGVLRSVGLGTGR